MSSVLLDENEKIENLVKTAFEAIDDKKGEEIRILDISKVSVIADYFIIAHGNNINQVQSICDEVEQRLGRLGVHAKQVEGYEKANWILMDFGDIIIHVFDKENRLFYDLERIWRDGEVVDSSKFTKK